MAKEKTVWPGSTQLAPVPVVLVGCGNGKGDVSLSEFRKRSENGVVLQIGDDHVIPVLQKSVKSAIDGVGGVLGEDHVFRFCSEVIRKGKTGGKDGLRRLVGQGMTASSGVGSVVA